MDQWQIDLINTITIGHVDYDNKVALELANEWNNAGEKWMFVTDTFCLSNDSSRVDYLVDRIEVKFEKILEANKITLDDNALSWLWICAE